jgi:hypothetical protein
MFFKNPIRYAAITTWAQIMFNTGAIIPWMIAQMAGKGADVKQTMEAAMVFFITPTVPALIALGVKQAVKRGGWDRAWANILGPLLELGGDALQVVIAYISGGPTAAAAAGVEFVAKRLTGVPPVVIVCLRATAKIFGTILAVLQDPSTIKGTAFWAAIGGAIESVAGQITGAANEVIAVIRGLGKSLVVYSQTISFLLNGNLQAATDDVLKQTFGFDMVAWNKMTASDRQRLASPKVEAFDMLKSVDGIVRAFIDALANVVKFLQINPLIEMLRRRHQSSSPTFCGTGTPPLRPCRKKLRMWKRLGRKKPKPAPPPRRPWRCRNRTPVSSPHRWPRRHLKTKPPRKPDGYSWRSRPQRTRQTRVAAGARP